MYVHNRVGVGVFSLLHFVHARSVLGSRDAGLLVLKLRTTKELQIEIEKHIRAIS